MTKIIADSAEELAKKKLHNSMWDQLETALVPSHNKTIYCLMGYTGRLELGTFRHWIVRCFRSEEKAEIFAKACSQHAKEWERYRDSYTESPPFGWSQLDPQMIMSHEGTYYRVFPTVIEMRPEDIPIDECPTCGGNLVELQEGCFICEEGHDVGD